MKRKYVVTSGKGINLVLHRGSHYKLSIAIEKAKKLKNKGKKNVAIKYIDSDGGMSHYRYV